MPRADPPRALRDGAPRRLAGPYARVRLLEPPPHRGTHVVHTDQRRMARLPTEAPAGASHLLLCRAGHEAHYLEAMAGNLDHAHVAHAPAKRPERTLPITPGVSVVFNGQVAMLYLPATALPHLRCDAALPLQDLAWAVETLVRRMAIATRHPDERRLALAMALPRTDWMWVDLPDGTAAFMKNPPDGGARVHHRNMPPVTSRAHLVPEAVLALARGWTPAAHVGVLTLARTAQEFAHARACWARQDYPRALRTWYVLNATGAPLADAPADAVIVTPPEGASIAAMHVALRAVCPHETVARLDPDAWYAADSLRLRVMVLERGHAHDVRAVGACVVDVLDGAEARRSPMCLDELSECAVYACTLAYVGARPCAMEHTCTLDDARVILAKIA
jgi:hypothetical protein